MVNETLPNAGTVTQVKGFLDSIVQFVNELLTQFIPGNEEWAVVALAVYLGYEWRNRDFASGGYDVWLKASLVFYLILKIFGLGSKLF